MLTSRERERCRAIAQALDRHDMGPWRKAEASLSVEAKGAIWDFRQHVIERGAQAGKVFVTPTKTPRPPRVETEFRDLDHWASDDDQDGDGDDDDEAETVPCSACNGAGKDVTGRVCEACGGSGRVTPDDEDDEEKDDEREDEE